MQVIDLKEMKNFYNSDGVRGQKFHRTELAEIVRLEIQPGATLKLHKTPVDVVFYVLAGEGQIQIGDEVHTVGQDMAIESPQMIPHGWTNSGTEPLCLLVIKLPAPPQ